MPLTLTEFLLSIPFTTALLFSPWFVATIWRKKSLKPVFVTYLVVTSTIVVAFWALTMIESM